MELLAGMSGTAQIDISYSPMELKGVVIPQYALCHRPSVGDYVWLVEDERSQVKMRKVSKGKLFPYGKVHVKEELSTDDVIATTGLRFLFEGTKVMVSTKKY